MFYPNEVNSWEPSSNIINKQMIKDFENARKNKPEDQISNGKNPANFKVTLQKPNLRVIANHKRGRKSLVKTNRFKKTKREHSFKDPKNVYGCQRGEKIENIMWLFCKRHCLDKRYLGDTVYARVKYTSGTTEAVPVKLLRRMVPNMWDDYVKECPLSINSVGLDKKIIYGLQRGEKIMHITRWVRNQDEIFLKVKYAMPNAYGQYHLEYVPINIVKEFAPDVFEEYRPVLEAIELIKRNRKTISIRINEPIEDQVVEIPDEPITTKLVKVPRELARLMSPSKKGFIHVANEAEGRVFRRRSDEKINGAPLISTDSSAKLNICPLVKDVNFEKSLKRTTNIDWQISYISTIVTAFLSGKTDRKSTCATGSHRLANIIHQHDSNGLFVRKDGSKIDLCDCLNSDCFGCWMPCRKCKSRKCGSRCRNNRNGCVMKLETVNSKPQVTWNPFYDL
uniref:ARF7 effector protein C-terminal domain-containing protein n=1 Tax=Acrobeloides nanus TaxID=290746 RepID=A0A914CDT7_9BILA